MKKKTTEQFISDAITVHGDKYDYSLVDYRTCKEKIKIICKIHGEFSQVPDKHLHGQGCPECGNIKLADSRLTSREEFIDRAEKIHGKFYDYSLVNFRKITEKVTIICPVHGEFKQNGMSHLVGKKCMRCAIESNPAAARRKLDTEKFLKKAKEVHGDRYDYSKSIYNGSRVKLTITCRIHGDFEQAPSNHYLNKIGCPACSAEFIVECAERKRVGKDEFIKRSKRHHGDKYDYSKVVCEGISKPVEIICPEHGPFWQIMQSHMYAGQGCPICAKSGFDPSKDAFVYLLVSDDMLKVGITNRTPEHRASKINHTSPQKFSVMFSIQVLGEEAQRIEGNLLKWLKSELKQPIDKFDGYCECFYVSHITPVDVIHRMILLKGEAGV